MIFLAVLILIFVCGVAFAGYQLNLDLGHRFVPNPQDFPKPNFPYETRRIKTSDNLGIAAWYIPVKNPKAVVILVHGYNPQGGKAEMLPHADYLYKAGYSTLLLDLRGNGESEGGKVTLGAKEWQDLEAVYNYLKSLPENSGKKIGFLGESMGAATSIIAVGKTGKGDFLIADVPFASYQRLFAFKARNQGFGWIPGISLMLPISANFILGFGYQNFSPDQLIQNVHVPIFIAWSDNDMEIGPNQGSQLYKLANQPKEQWQTSFGHDITDKNISIFGERVLSFLNTYIKN